MKKTVSVIKADVGGIPGHGRVHEELKKTARDVLKSSQIIDDFYVTACGDDLQLIMLHSNGVDSEEIHSLAWNTFTKATEVAKGLRLYGAGQDLLKDSFSGNIKGMGPGFAEMEFELRKSEPIVVFMADKTDPGAFNLPMFKIFGDPFNTAGLVIDPSMHNGFKFEVWDIVEHKKAILTLPEEMYDLLSLIGSTSRFVIKRIYPNKNPKVPDHEPAAVISSEKVNVIAGKYVGKDDPVAVVRAQSGLPAVGEILEPFTFPHLVSGWMRGSHVGPLMPVSEGQATPTRFDGPPRVMALGFQVTENRLIGPVDLFDDVGFDRAREKVNEIADYMRRHGPFTPHRLPLSEMEYTTLPNVLEKLKDRFTDI